MADTQSSTQSDSQTQKSKIWQNELGEARTDATEVRTDPFQIHQTKLIVIYPTKRRKKKKKKQEKKNKQTKKKKPNGDQKRSACQACDLHIQIRDVKN